MTARKWPEADIVIAHNLRLVIKQFWLLITKYVAPKEIP
jgi:hypothetical protein